MSLKKNLFRLRHTLAFRLTLWYAGIFMFSACLAFFFFYLLITSVIRQQTDQGLSSEVRTFSSILSTQGTEAVKRQAFLESQAAGEKKIFFRLLYISGQVFSSSNMSYWRDIGINKHAINQMLNYVYVFIYVRLVFIIFSPRNTCAVPGAMSTPRIK